jgi:hypothetical protein
MASVDGEKQETRGDSMQGNNKVEQQQDEMVHRAKLSLQAIVNSCEDEEKIEVNSSADQDEEGDDIIPPAPEKKAA